MKIDFTINENTMVIKIEGRLDSVTAPELEKVTSSGIGDVTAIIFDFTKLRYISSAGLRVILACSKKIREAQGTLVIENPNEIVMDVFEATGFVDILDIRQN